MAGYDPKKAAEYNKLIQQGVAPEAAIVQAGITYEEQGNYEINSVGTAATNNSYGKMSDIAVPQSAASAEPPIAVSFPGGTYLFNSQAELDAYQDAPGTYASSFTGGGYTVTKISPPPQTASAVDANINGLDLPNNYTGPATSKAAVDANINGLDLPDNYTGPLTSRVAVDANINGLDLPDNYTGPTTSKAAVDANINGLDLPDNYTGPATSKAAVDANINGLDLPDNFTGPPTSRAAVDTNNGGEGFGVGTPDGNGGFVDARGDPVDSNGMPIAGVPPTTYSSPVSDPYYGLTSTQLQDLGGADPTDPYIRARLGIPQLPGSTLFATGGFGTIKTGVPAIDSALGIIGGGVTSLFSNFSNTIGGLFGAKPTASAAAATTGSGVAALVAPVTGPPTSNTAVDTNNGGEGFGLGTPDGNGGFVNAQGDPVDSVGMPIAGVPPTTYSGTTLSANETAAQFDGIPPGDGTTVSALTAKGVDTTTLSADQADAFYNGTGTLTADQRIAQDQQTAADAAALYPGSNNTNLKNIDAASGAIARNQVGISNAEQIIAENNAELADPNISDERRAELESNNASQENYIRLANDNTAEQELVIEANADGYAAGGGNPDSGQGPDQVAALTDPGLDPNFVSDAEQIAARERAAVNEAQDQDPGLGYVSDAEQIAAQERAAVNEAQDLTTSEDPFEQSRLDAQEALDAQPPDEFEPQDVSAEQDPFEAARLEAEQELNRQQLTEEATDVEPGLFTGQTDEFGGVDEAVAQQQQDVDNQNDPGLSAEETDAEFERLRTEDQETNDVDPGPGYVSDSEAIAAQERAAVNEAQDQDPGPGYVSDSEAIAAQGRGGLAEAQESQFQGSQESAVRDKAKQQATFQARYKQPGNADWRVRLSLAPDAQYLYNEKSGVGILAPLAKTDGVIFPYTPNITTTYSAQYEQYDLVHSNYRGLFYKNSRVGDIQIRGTFTAQDTNEADYLLAVIHFFRSATKMFYGQDAQRGVPPPVCLLNGLGQYQFSDHPVVISSFNYTLPNDVDYIRAGSPNNYGTNMLNRRAAVASNPGGQSLAGLNRLANALLKKGAPGQGIPDPSAIQQNVSNTAGASYVPTKMEIDITLIPVQTRTQVSKQFSLKGFANGQLLKGGFW